MSITTTKSTGSTRSFWGVMFTALFITLITAAAAFAQETANVPITVNVAATVTATPPAGLAGAQTVTETVQANVQKTLTLVATQFPNSIKHGLNRHHTPATVSRKHGAVALSLNSQTFKNAEVSLFSINGRSVMRRKVSANTDGIVNLPSANIAAGTYMLSVKGVDKNSFATKLVHGGGKMNINVAFFSADAGIRQTANVETNEWTINVEAAGYTDTTILIAPVKGDNPALVVTLNEAGEATNFTIAVSADWTEALQAIRDGGNDKNYVLNVTGDISYPGMTSATFGSVTGITVTMTGNGSITATAASNNTLRIGAQQKVIIDGPAIIATGGGTTVNLNQDISGSGAELVLKSGKVQNAGSNAAVNVSRGTFTMEGGEISRSGTATGSVSGGVFVQNSSTFTMEGGEIKNIAGAVNGGGVRVNGSGATFEMNGGTIYGDDAAEGLKNTAASGGAAIHIENGTVTINGHTVTASISTTVDGATYDPTPATNPFVGVWVDPYGVSFTFNEDMTYEYHAGEFKVTGNYTFSGNTATFTTGAVLVKTATIVGNTLTNDDMTYTKQTAPTYNIGDTGPGGGIIFYVSTEGFDFYTGTGDTKVTAHYLEAATENIAETKVWGTVDLDVAGTGTAIGTGLKNTKLIISTDVASTDNAATACDGYSNNGKTDWFLPSFDELWALYGQRALFGLTSASGSYWSSSQSGAAQARRVQMVGSQGTIGKENAYNVRPIRAF